MGVLKHDAILNEIQGLGEALQDIDGRFKLAMSVNGEVHPKSLVDALMVIKHDLIFSKVQYQVLFSIAESLVEVMTDGDEDEQAKLAVLIGSKIRDRTNVLIQQNKEKVENESPIITDIPPNLRNRG
jgi:hypothetical protein